MSGFSDFRPAQWSVWGMYGSAILVVVGFAMVIRGTFVQPATALPNRQIKCSVETCDYAVDMTFEECEAMAAQNYEQMKVNDPESANTLLEILKAGPFGGRVAFGANTGDPEAATKMLEQMIVSQWGNPQTGPPFVCPTCQESSAFKAMNCSECETIFFKGIAQDPRYADRCPNASCGYSAAEVKAKSRRAERLKK